MGGGDDQLWRSTCAIAGCIVVCYGGGRVTANFGGVRGAIAGPIVVCWRVTTNFWGVGVVPLQGAIVVCYGWAGAFFLYIDNTKVGFC